MEALKKRPETQKIGPLRPICVPTVAGCCRRCLVLPGLARNGPAFWPQLSPSTATRRWRTALPSAPRCREMPPNRARSIANRSPPGQSRTAHRPVNREPPTARSIANRSIIAATGAVEMYMSRFKSHGSIPIRRANCRLVRRSSQGEEGRPVSAKDAGMSIRSQETPPATRTISGDRCTAGDK